MKARQNLDLSDILLFLLLGTLWGGSFIAIKVIVEIVPPWWSGAIRMVVALIALRVIFAIRKIPVRLPPARRAAVWGAGLVTIGLPFAALFWAEQRVPASLGGIMNGSTPLWTALFLSWAEGKKLSGRAIFGLLLGFLGIVIIFAPGFSLGTKDDAILGASAAMLMAICYAASNILNRRLMTSAHNLHLPTVVYHQHAASFVFLGLLAFLFEPFPTRVQLTEPLVLWSFLFLGVLSSAIAMMMHFHLIKKIGALKTSAVTYLVPISAIIFEGFLLHQWAAPSALIGVVFILTGLFMVRSAPTH